MSNQLPLPSTFDHSLPVECSGPELGDTIAQVERAGLCVRRMDVVGAAGYRLHLQRTASTSTAMSRVESVIAVAWLVVANLGAWSL